MDTGKFLEGQTIYLHLTPKRAGYEAVVGVAKRWEDPPIDSATLAVLLESEEGTLLRPTRCPPAGPLVEVGSVGATATACYRFAAPRGVRLRRAIVILRGQWVEFDVKEME
jgi:hypothetical protein